MGLDMYLTKYSQKEDVGYWRKAYAIDKWISNNCEGGDYSNCREIHISKKTLEKLKAACEEVLANHSKAGKLLPDDCGYGEDYFEQLKYTVKIIDEVLETTNFATQTVMFMRWW